MNIIDTHVHFWDLALKQHSWILRPSEPDFIGSITPIRQNYLPANIAIDNHSSGHNLAGVIHVQAGWDKTNPVAETQWLTQCAEQFTIPFGIVGYVDLTSPEAEQTLKQHSQSAYFKGIRQILNYHPNAFYSGCDQDYATHPNFSKGFALLKKFNLSFDLQAYPQQITQLLPLFQQHPETKIIVEHCAMPLFLTESDVNKWQTSLAQLANLPNTYLKLSGLSMFMPYASKWLCATDILQICLQYFTPDRCLFGSNFPVDSLYGTYADSISPIQALKLSTTKQRAIFVETAKAVYCLE